VTNYRAYGSGRQRAASLRNDSFKALVTLAKSLNTSERRSMVLVAGSVRYGRAKGQLLAKLKYLMACVEEVGRLESLRLRIADAVQGRLSFPELETAVAVAKKQMAEAAADMATAPIVVFGLV